MTLPDSVRAMLARLRRVAAPTESAGLQNAYRPLRTRPIILPAETDAPPLDSGIARALAERSEEADCATTAMSRPLLPHAYSIAP